MGTQEPRGKRHIPPQGFQPTRTARVAALLFHQFSTSERQPRLPRRFARFHASRDPLAGFLFQVKEEFVVQFGFHGAAPDDAP